MNDPRPGEDYPGVGIVFFCHDGAGRFVMSKRGVNCRDEHGRWDPGGGALHFGDTVEHTLRREIKEEYGADVKEFEFLGYRDVHREEAGRKLHWIALDFKVLVDSAQVRNAEPQKFDAVEWFSLDALPTPLHTQFSKFLEMYCDRLR